MLPEERWRELIGQLTAEIETQQAKQGGAHSEHSGTIFPLSRQLGNERIC